jgi:hypothetical protein
MSLLVIAPGMPLDDVVRRSTVHIGVCREPDGWAVAQPRGAHTVLVEHSVHGFVLEEGHFTVIEATGGRVVRVVATPQADLLGWRETWQRARAMAASLRQVGWRARSRFATEESVSPDRDTVLGTWAADGWKLELRLRRTMPATPDMRHGLDPNAAVWLLSVTLEGATT